LRIVVYVLALGNLGLWAWTAWFAPQPPEAFRFDGPGLKLLSEQNLVASPAPAMRCVRVGPFIDADDPDVAGAILAASSFDSVPVTGEAEIWDGFWVYVGQLADMDAAGESLALIEEADIDDAYVIQSTDNGILISLGIYTNLARANALADRVGELGLEATITDRTRLAEVVWLEFDQRAGDTTALELVQQQFVDGIEQRDCTSEL
jgi:hypothetical protein